MGECHRKIREGSPNFREDIKFFIGLPKQPLLELSPPVWYKITKSAAVDCKQAVNDDQRAGFFCNICKNYSVISMP